MHLCSLPPQEGEVASGAKFALLCSGNHVCKAFRRQEAETDEASVYKVFMLERDSRPN